MRVKRFSEQGVCGGISRAAVCLAALVLGLSSARAATYYVNDASTNGDCYCSAAGVDGAGRGTNAATPALTLAGLVANQDLEPGDTVYIDTGLYTNTTTTLSTNDMGTVASPVIFQGSTNLAAGGSVFAVNSAVANGFDILVGATGLRFRDLTVRNAQYGFSIGGHSMVFDRVVVASCTEGFRCSSTNHVMTGCAAIGNGTGIRVPSTGTGPVRWDNGVLWSNTLAVRQAYPTDRISISNSVIVGGTLYNPAGDVFAVGAPRGDFNLVYEVDLAAYASLLDLQAAGQGWTNASSGDPGFVNGATGDFHPRSVAGTYSNGAYATYAEHSRLIDTGNPLADYSLEAAPNGGRLDIGLYGNSAESSLSRTNAWLLALSMNESCEVSGTGRLAWTFGNLPTSTAVRIDWSPDNGTSWSAVATNLPVWQGYYFWNVSALTSTPAARWRLVAETAPYSGLSDTNTRVFTLRANGDISVYVNDASTNGDVYCAAPGSAANTGLTPAQPLNSLQTALSLYDLGAGDTLFVDTGIYTGETVTIGIRDGGAASADLLIRGSTNAAAGGTRFVRASATSDAVVVQASRVSLRNLRAEAARYGFAISGSLLTFDDVYSVSNSVGFQGTGSNVAFRGCVAAYNSSLGLSSILPASGPWTWDRGVSWSNGAAFRRSASSLSLSVSNSIIVGGLLWQPSGDTATVPPPSGDYNLIWSATLAGQYNNLSELQKARGDWLWSAFGDPAFVDPAGLDFHPRSVTGTFIGGSFVTQSVQSLAIDFASPASPYAFEPAPNGARLNAGNFGNNTQASLSRTNAWLYVLNYRDGGVLSVPTDTIRWNAGGMPTGATIRIEYSADGGATWQIAVTNLSAAAGAYTWTGTNQVSSRFARFRILYEADASVTDTTPTNFTFRNGPFVFYVNDASTNGDVYTSAIGSDTNLGTSAAAPKSTLANLLSVHDVEPGDIIYIDTGTYNVPANPQITAADAGSTGGYVVVQGSTNTAAGGSVISRGTTAAGAYALEIVSGAAYLDLRDLVLITANAGLRVGGSAPLRLTRITARNCVDGIDIVGASSVDADRLILRQNTGIGLYAAAGTTTVRRSVFWRNTAGLRCDAGLLAFTNSAIVASGSTAYGLLASTTTVIRSDYNSFHTESNAVVAFVTSLARNLDTLTAWQTELGIDRNSLEGDPRFADAANADFHLKTTAIGGRPTLSGGATNDTVTSPLIDAGVPTWPATNESGASAQRIDIGFWGDTDGASQPATGSRLVIASPVAGGYYRGTATLHWVAGGSATGGTVSVEASVDGGWNWSAVSTGLAAATETVAWDTTALSNTPAVVWRVTHEQLPGIAATSVVFAAIRNGSRTLSLYVNDSSITGDHYTAAAGAPTNYVATRAAPIDSPAALFNLVDLEPGDAVFVDTGSYLLGTNAVLRRQDGGSAAQSVIVAGSTNGSCTGTVLDRGDTGAAAYACQIDGASFVALSNLVVRNAGSGIYVAGASNIVFSRIRALDDGVNGFEVSSAQRVELRRCVAAGNGARGVAGTSSQLALDGCVIWSNGTGAIQINGGSGTATNCVLKSVGSGTYAIDIQSSGTWAGDWNDILVAGTARVGRVSAANFVDLAQWQQGGFTQDLRSLSHEPLFADPASGDFHPLSVAGRFTEAGTTNDAQTSPLIDAGAPAFAFSSEPAPNGGRIDIGPHGNDGEASLSPTNARLLALSLNSGGSARGSYSLYWLAGGAATGMTVALQYSSDGGTTWTNIATGLAASVGQYTWNSVPYGSSAQARWRVVSESNTNLLDQTDSAFTLNNGPLTYYVNDAVTNGDIYCIAPGSSGNSGITPGSPRASVQDVIDSFSLRPGDRILVDTGVYALPSTVTIDSTDSGSITNPVTIRGSTNVAAGGSAFSLPGGTAFRVDGNPGVVLEHLRITNANIGIVFSSSPTGAVRDVSIAASTAGLDVQNSAGLALRRVAVSSATRGLYQRGAGTADADGCVFWGCGYGVYVEAGGVGLTNSIIETTAAGQYAYFLGATATLSADFNDLFITNGAFAAYRAAIPRAIRWQSVGSWVAGNALDVRSLSVAPGFADPAAGDFHLLSQGGRLTLAGTFTNDSVSSPLLDAGSPSTAATNEPAPNGGRINLGIHGNTVRASRTPTNATLTIVAPNDGGRIGTTGTLYWVARGVATSHTATIELSLDAGASWQTLTNGFAASGGAWTWNTTSIAGRASCLWRITSVQQPLATDMSDAFFALRNQPLRFYVNDALTTGDVYASSAGASSNLGTIASAPAASIAQILDQYDLEAGDVVYVDSGTYAPTSTVLIGEFDAGVSTNPVVIQGSTNPSAPTVASGWGFEVNGADGVRLQDQIVSNATTAFRFRQSDNSGACRLTAVGGTTGIDLDDSDAVGVSNCIVRNAAGAAFYVRNSATAVGLDASVLWSNGVGVRVDSGSATVRGTVIGALTTNASAFYYTAGTLTSDYNDLVLRQGANAGYRPGSPNPTLYSSVGQWMREFGQDAHSLSHDPAFASELDSDFHPRSEAGRWTGELTYTNDADTSPLIDAASPAQPFALEPLPNGSRADMGAYGNSTQASLSPTSSVLLATSFNDGGAVVGAVSLNWLARGAITGQTLRIEFSADGGSSWLLVATGVQAGAGGYAWNSAAFPSTPLGRWRISGEANTNVYDISDANFAVRNSNLVFYVNDGATSGDVYCSAPGAATNSGGLASSPKASVQDVIDTFDLEPGDTVFVDTGAYALPADVVIGRLDAGVATQRVRIVGSTNTLAGGSAFNRQGGAYGFKLEQATGVELRNLSISNAATASVYLHQADDSLLKGLSTVGGAGGAWISDSDGISIENCTFRNASSYGVGSFIASTVAIENSLLWNNLNGVFVSLGLTTISNSVIGASGSGRYAYNLTAGGTPVLRADFNLVRMTGGASVAFVAGAPAATTYGSVALWSGGSTQDLHTLTHDPLFADETGADFHPRSAAGRWKAPGSYTNDAVTSPLVDAGFAGRSFSVEPMPNGGRLDVGRYGNDAESSLSPTGAALTAVTFNDGGRVAGTVDLFWRARGAATSQTVRIEFSADDGATWSVLSSNLAASAESNRWDSTLQPNTPLARWRVVNESDPAIADQSDTNFYLRNGPLAYFVNDASTVGDAYCTAAGNASNTGVSASSPRLSVQAVLDAYDLEPGDTLYIDTGLYVLSSAITIGLADSGSPTQFVNVVGSTNMLAGGTILNRFGGDRCILSDSGTGLGFRQLTLRNAGTAGILLYHNTSVRLEDLRIENCGIGLDLDTSSSVTARQCVVRNATADGIRLRSSTCDFQNGVLWSNVTGARLESGQMTLRNDIIGAYGASASALYLGSATLDSDYNCYHLTNGATVATALGGLSGGGTSRYVQVGSWSFGTGRDLHSLAIDPGVASAASADFHPLSSAGRYLAGSGFVTDAQTSPLVDSGDPSLSVGSEPSPNGGRINIGWQGGAAEGSKSPTNARLLAISFNDGGTVYGALPLNWVAAGAATGHTVRVEFSADGGLSYGVLATGLAASAGTYTWNSASATSTPRGVWRVVSENDPSVADGSDAEFALRQSSGLIYYVNDGSTTGDVFCTAVGRSTNLGFTAASPLDSLSHVLATFDLEPGDRVYVDTGTYSEPFGVVVGAYDAGSPTNPVLIIGSTNEAAGGSLIDRQLASPATAGLTLLQTAGVRVRDLRIANAGVGLLVVQSPSCTVERVRASSCLTGFGVSNSLPVSFSGCIAHDNTDQGLKVQLSAVAWLNGAIWNSGSAANLLQATLRVTNSVLQGSGSGGRVYRIDQTSVVQADYNDVLCTNGAFVAEVQESVGGASIYPTMTDWIQGQTSDRHSLSHEPGFASPVGGDFHLRSSAGRFQSGTGFVADTNDSVLIDAGNPGFTYTNEPAPNGGRINLGPDGNHGEASLSRTNAWLLAVTFNDGGRVAGTNNLVWFHGNLAPTTTVAVEYSPDQGIEWYAVATSIAVSAGSCVWDVSPLPASSRTLWRVRTLDGADVRDQVDTTFILRPEPLTYYVNDASTNGDVYTTAPGNDLNSGTTPASPLASLATLFRDFTPAAGDTIYVDTGSFTATNTLAFDVSLRGATGFPIRVIGSTNGFAGGSVLRLAVTSSAPVVSIDNAQFIELSNLRLEGGSRGVFVSGAEAIALSGLSAISNSTDGIFVSGSRAVTLERCLAARNGAKGFAIAGSTAISMDRCVAWSNATGALSGDSSSLAVQGCILQQSGVGTYAWTVGSGLSLSTDYNLYWLQGGALIARNTFLGQTFARLVEWQNGISGDYRSLLGDPLFVSPESGDFHLRSAGGHASPGGFTNDVTTSPALDAADPAAGFALESSPNGSRMNLGLHGNTVEASRTPATPRLIAGSLADGGTVSGSQWLYWVAQGLTTGDLVNVAYSADGGVTWIGIATNIPAVTTGILWSSSTFPASPAGIWRVMAAADTNLFSMSGSNFLLRTGPVSFYVNDGSTAGDCYTLAAGNSAASGLTPLSPMDSLQRVFDTYDLEGGDTVYVDTGLYNLTANITLSVQDGGASTARVTVAGSTNVQAGGTLFSRGAVATAGTIGFSASGASHLNLANFTIRRADQGLRLFQCASIGVSNVVLIENGGIGLSLDQANGVRVDRSAIARGAGTGVWAIASSVDVLRSVVWSNASDAVSVHSTTLSVSNSILHARGASRYCLRDQSSSVLRSDFNDLVPESGAYYGLTSGGVPVESMPQWVSSRGIDRHTLSVDPLFAAPLADDFHLLSASGRFAPTSGTFVVDALHSPLIDAGAPEVVVGEESAPNGGRINIGPHGGTAEASRSRTNAWLYAVTASAGGRVSGSLYLDWLWGGLDATNTVDLEYSYDDGATWTPIAGGVAIDSDGYPWDSTVTLSNEDVYVSSPVSRWRVVLTGTTNLSDQTDSYFALRNSPFVYYINDTSTVGDVYTTAVGSDTNLGLFKYAPKATLESLLGSLDAEGGDIIEIDTGVYVLTNTFGTLGVQDSGRAGEPLVLRGSTNGTILRRASGPTTTLAFTGPYLTVRDLRIEGGSLVSSSDSLDLARVTVSNGSLTLSGGTIALSNATIHGGGLIVSSASGVTARAVRVRNGAVTFSGASSAVLLNAAVSGTASNGVQVAGLGSVSVSNCSVSVSGNAVALSGSAVLQLRNNILVANGADRFCIARGGGILVSDYNDLLARNGAWIGSQNGNWERLAYWQRETGLDLNSLSHEPLFADEAGGDLHLRSATGRYTNGAFAADAVHSPAIDAGSGPVDAETAPNGGIVNLGAYGATVEASRSRTNEWILAVAPNDGGVVRGSTTLRWTAGGVTTNTVTLQYSPDAGTSWVTIATGIAATNGSYAWNSATVTSSLRATWRVLLDSPTGIVDSADNLFAVRNQPLTFFVNDAVTNGDVYTTATGSSTNDGLAPSRPMESLARVLNTYDLEGGDTAFVDTGAYVWPTNQVMIWSDGGESITSVVTLAGSTNAAAGGTVLARGSTVSGSDALDLRASFVNVRDLGVRDAFRGLLLTSNRNVSVRGGTFSSNEYGVVVSQSASAGIGNLLVLHNRSGGIDISDARTVTVENCTFDGNVPFAVRTRSSTAAVVHNNIFAIPTNTATALDGQLTSIAIDYNLYQFDAPLASIHPTNAGQTLLYWQIANGHDYRSAITNADFANQASHDFHLKSQYGRYVDGSGWTTDSITSWGIDAGNPATSYALEPGPSGNRVNLGAYGGTRYASRGATQVLARIRQLNDTPSISSTNSYWPLIWSAVNIPTGDLVNVQFSGDGGLTWFTLATNISPYQEVVLWQTTPFFNTYKGRWRVTDVTQPAIAATNAATFQIFYGDYAISTLGVNASGRTEFVWRGAWGENYRIQYATNIALTNAWANVPSGVAPEEISVFTSTNGGDFLFRDVTSTGAPMRIYRVLRQ